MRRNAIPVRSGLLALAAFVILSAPHPLQAERPEIITFLHYWSTPYSLKAITDLVDVVNAAHPRFHIESNKFEMESFKVAIQAMLSGGDPPDLFTYWAGERVQSLVDAGLLSPIDDIWEAENLSDRFPAPVADACTYNGHKYAIPLTRFYAAFFYNARIFKDHNLSVPKTWPEFLSVCETLKSAGVAPIALGSRYRWPAQFWFDYLLLRTAGPVYRRALMTGKAAYDDPEVERVFGLWKQLMDRGYFYPRPNLYNWPEAAKMVYAGQAGMTLMGNWITGLFENQLNWQEEKDFDFFPFPVIDPDAPDASVGPIDCVVLSKASGSEAARTVLPFFSDVPPQRKLIRQVGSLSPNLQTPSAVFTPLQQNLLAIVNKSPHWAFNYDLATPPPAADIGLSAFAEFLDSPENYPAILKNMETRIGKLPSFRSRR